MPFPLLGILGAAAPFLGKMFGGGSGTGGMVGASASGAAGGMADERTRQNMFLSNQNNNQTSRYGIQQGAKTNLLSLAEQAALDRAKLGLAAPGARANQVLKGSLMEMVQPASMSHPRAHIPQISGGLTPAALSPSARQAGRDLQSQGLLALQNKSDVPPPTDFAGGMIEPPEMYDYKQPGKGESIVGGIGSFAPLIGQIIAALAKQGGGAQPNDSGFEYF